MRSPIPKRKEFEPADPSENADDDESEAPYFLFFLVRL